VSCGGRFCGTSRTTTHESAAAIEMITMMYTTTPSRLRTVDKATVE